jgi:hypothetical protein
MQDRVVNDSRIFVIKIIKFFLTKKGAFDPFLLSLNGEEDLKKFLVYKNVVIDTKLIITKRLIFSLIEHFFIPDHTRHIMEEATHLFYSFKYFKVKKGDFKKNIKFIFNRTHNLFKKIFMYHGLENLSIIKRHTYNEIAKQKF